MKNQELNTTGNTAATKASPRGNCPLETEQLGNVSDGGPKGLEGVALEVCCADLQSVRAAIEGGAHRVELCQALGLDGLTPSAGMTEQAVGMGIHVQVLVRPREGDFVYDRDEVLCMQRDIRHARRLGAGGVVIGALKPDGSIDAETVRRLVGEAEGLSITFHRAFDVCAHPEEALEQIISLGCHRLLTSGQAATAEQGIPMIKKLVEQANGRLIIMPGAGVNPQNAWRILSETGASEIHGSLRRNGHTDPEQVRAIVRSPLPAPPLGECHKLEDKQ